MNILYRQDLSAMRCASPGCRSEHEDVYLTPKCHPGTPTRTRWNGLMLAVTCAECDKAVCEIAVAPRFAPAGNITPGVTATLAP